MTFNLYLSSQQCPESLHSDRATRLYVTEGVEVEKISVRNVPQHTCCV